MKPLLPKFNTLRSLPRDGRLLFVTRFARMFGYGFLSVVLFLYLKALGMSDARGGLLLTLTLAGDTAISLWLTTRADRFGRRKTLIIGSALMLLAGIVFAISRDPIVLLIAATIGVISPNGKEVGPFLSVEQAALSQVTAGGQRTAVFAWYNLFGSVAAALGALACGSFSEVLQHNGVSEINSYRAIVVGYAIIGAVLALIFPFLSDSVEVNSIAKAQAPETADPPLAPSRPTSDRAVLDYATPKPRTWLGLHKSRNVVLRLSGLFAIDAFAGGFVMDSILAYWFFKKFEVPVVQLGSIFFGANMLAAISALSAARIAERFGLINTMVFTHLPSNVLLLLVPFMPTYHLAVLVLLARFSISQMDVPTRQAYTMAVVDPDERSAAGGFTGVARSTGASLSPSLAGLFLSRSALLSMPFILGGTLKIIYDLLLYRRFRKAHVRES